MDATTKTYDDMGVEFLTEPVSKQSGSNKSDRHIWRNDAQILRVVDLEKFSTEFGANAALAGLNGTSFRVMSQDVNRRHAANEKFEIVQTAIINRLRGLRNAAVATVRTVEKIVEKRVYALPDGTTYDGTNEVEYQQAWVAALTAAGMPTTAAITFAKLQKLS
jgi:formiminotetrahydrofolate cyclodeaminase